MSGLINAIKYTSPTAEAVIKGSSLSFLIANRKSNTDKPNNAIFPLEADRPNANKVKTTPMIDVEWYFLFSFLKLIMKNRIKKFAI